MVHGSSAYFSSGHRIYLYTSVSENKWTKLPECKCERFAIAVVNDTLTTIGGWDSQWGVIDNLLSLSGSSWEEIFPPMPTKCLLPASANTPTHLVVAGGLQSLLGNPTATVQVLNTETLQWSTASSLPQAVGSPQMTICERCLYLAGDEKVFLCFVEDLHKSTTWSSDGGSAWTRLASIPTPQWSTLATLRGHVLAVGGRDDIGNPTGAIHCYDMATNSWSVTGEIPTPRSRVLTAVFPSNELVVVGGLGASRDLCVITEIGNS